jgi:hypothetical protein
MCTLCVRTSIDREFVADFLKDSYPIGDWPLSIYVSATHEVGYLPLSTAVYRRVAGSMMNSGRKARARLTAAYIPMIEDICDRMRVASAERSQALLPLYRALYSLAFFAGDEVLFGRAVDWLRKNDKAFLSPWQRRIKTWLVRAPMICSMLAAKHEIWLAFDEWRRYRPEHP